MDAELKLPMCLSGGNGVLSRSANRIALQTMKERCYLLQHRLNTLEKENVQLSVTCSKIKPSYAVNIPASVESLNASVAQLTKEKSQLAHHIFIVACENKKLWSRLSQMTKVTNPEKDKRCQAVESEPTEKIEFAAPTLNRSQTFTHYKSDSKLAAKLEEESKDFKNSLEEISLKLIDTFLLEKSELVHQYEQMVDMQINYEKTSNESSIGFTYLDDFNNDSLAAIKKQKEQMCNLKKLALQQQRDLKDCLSNIGALKSEKGECKKCKILSKNLMETSPNKEKLETSSSDVGLHDSSTKWETANSLTSFNDELVERLPPSRAHQTSVMNISESSQNTSGINNASTYYDSPGLFPQHLKKNTASKKSSRKICPMCGKCFVDTTFDVFEIHVENHFIADDEFDSIGENYEVLTSSVGNNFN